MAQFVPALSRQQWQVMTERTNAIEVGTPGYVVYTPQISDDVRAIAQQLTVDIPGFDWTIEVDVLGRHRITIHFKGGSISLDE